MEFVILTTFPDMLRPMISGSILGRAAEKGLITVKLVDPRPFSALKHKNTDDYPFGGGAGMLMLAQPIVDAVEKCEAEGFRGKKLYMSPRGRRFDQRMAEELAREPSLMLLCGHYEGVDQMAIDIKFDGEVSIGDFVLTGGELGALVVLDAVARLIPGVLGDEESPEDESFSTGLLEYPQYTRPRVYRGMEVPNPLLGGDHARIARWRRERSLELTLDRRPDLLMDMRLTPQDEETVRRAWLKGEQGKN